MKCPVCDVQLSISSREGVEIDFCPQCRGVWLDRGELDKVIERAAASLAPASVGGRESGYYDERREPRYDERHEPRYDDRDHRDYDDHRGRERDQKKRKRRSFLEDLFEFD